METTEDMFYDIALRKYHKAKRAFKEQCIEYLKMVLKKSEYKQIASKSDWWKDCTTFLNESVKGGVSCIWSDEKEDAIKVTINFGFAHEYNIISLDDDTVIKIAKAVKDNIEQYELNK
jgi:hypothetical protein